MPYIDQKDRDEIDQGIRLPEVPGELAYVIYSTVVDYVSQFDPSFVLYNDVTGVLQNVSLEFHRRYIAPYEDEKLQINGDVQ